jgi:hypothetical protein
MKPDFMKRLLLLFAALASSCSPAFAQKDSALAHSSTINSDARIRYLDPDDHTLAATGTDKTISFGDLKTALSIPSGTIDLTTSVINILPVAHGGTGTATPGLIQGTNVTITGSWPNQTINSTASGGGGGTVTSVSLTVPSGLTVTGSPVTGAGTLAITTTLNGMLMGNGSGFVVATEGTNYLAPAGNGSQLTGLTSGQVGLGNVENTALSTWTGSANETTLGTITTGTWHATAIADTWIASASTWNAKQSSITTGTTAQYIRGDLSLGTLNAAAVAGLGTSATHATTDYEVPLTFSTGLNRTGNTITANGGGGGGAVAAVKFALKTDTQSTTSIYTTWVDITGLSITYSATSASNKILLLTALNLADDGPGIVLVRLVRDTTSLSVGDAGAGQSQAASESYTNTDPKSNAVAVNLMDSPGDTASHTYKVQFCVATAGTGYVNRTTVDSASALYSRTVSTLTLMEVTP